MRADHLLPRAAHRSGHGAEYPEDHATALQHGLGLSVRRPPGLVFKEPLSMAFSKLEACCARTSMATARCESEWEAGRS